MKNYLKAEIVRILKRPSFSLLTLALAGLSVILNLFYSKNEFTNQYSLAFSNIPNFYFIGLFVVIFFVDIVSIEEFKNNTIKNIISSGLSRWEIILVKIIATSILGIISALFILVIYFLTGYFMLSINNPSQLSYLFSNLALELLAVIPLWIAGATVGIFVSLLTNKTWSFILLYFLFLQYLSQIINGLASYLGISFLSKLGSLTGILSLINSIGFSQNLRGDIGYLLTAGIVNIIIYSLLSILVFNKKDF